MRANPERGLRRTNADKRRAVTAMVKARSGWSDRDIAKHVGVSQPLVSKLRAELTTVISSEAEGARLNPPVREGRDGKASR